MSSSETGPVSKRPRIDILCRVVDYFGDAGIGWRLASELASAHGFEACLWIDRPDIVKQMAPTGQAFVQVRHLDQFDRDYKPGQVLLSTFDSRIPAEARHRIGAGGDRTLRVHFEYLSAEPWIDDCHGLPSLKSDGSKEWMFMPGFTQASGGLLREHDLAARQRSFDARARSDLRARLGDVHSEPVRRMSLFCYPQAPADDWFAQLADGPASVLYAAHGVAHDAAYRFFGRDPRPGEQVSRGNLGLLRMPFLSQSDYDQLLWSCDLNFVRGEDSWVRAQWAASPFVWQPYIQPDGTHLTKLDAFLDRALQGTPGQLSATIRNFSHAWSGNGELARAWPAFEQSLAEPAALLPQWRQTLLSQTDCCTRLAALIHDKLE